MATHYPQKNMKTNIALLENDSQYCVFNIELYEIFGINKFTYDVLSHYIQYLDMEATSALFDISKEELSRILTQIHFSSNSNSTLDANAESSSFRKIQRITLHIANDCNLRCKYCYASGGTYNQSRGLMTPETAVRFVDFCCENFEEVSNIVFFGGEPFLNMPIIELVCELFHKYFDNGKICYLPKFGAITNGTILSDKTFYLIERYFSFLTISIDGPKFINDLNRVFPNGEGSFDRIDKFIKKVKNFPNLQIGIESTFTKSHIKAGHTHESIKNFINSTYNLPVDVVDEIEIDKDVMMQENLDNYLESPWFINILSTIVNKQAETKCPIIHSVFAIAINGDIYPCHMNVGDEMNPVSSIWKNSDVVHNVLENSNEFKLKDNPICLNCWAKNLCGGCSRSWYYDSDKHKYTNIPNSMRCDDFRRIVKLAILKIYVIRKNPILWENLLQKLGIRPLKTW